MANNENIQLFEDRIQLLTDLYNRLDGLRQIPITLLKPPGANDLPTPTPLRSEFETLKVIGETVRSERVQEALRIARDSEKVDRSDLGSNFRRENRKRRRPPSPESPQPYVSFQPKTCSLFPTNVDETPPLRIDDLPSYIREFNKTHQMKLHIWSRNSHRDFSNSLSAPSGISNPTIVRFQIPDVLTAFITLGYTKSDPVLIVQIVTAFGPREKKSPHSQSDYTAYQNLSQQIAKIIRSRPRVPFQGLMVLLSSYRGLFVERCTECNRVLSAEGHIPPVGRIWIDAGTGTNEEEFSDHWQPRHIQCLLT